MRNFLTITESGISLKMRKFFIFFSIVTNETLVRCAVCSVEWIFFFWKNIEVNDEKPNTKFLACNGVNRTPRRGRKRQIHAIFVHLKLRNIWVSIWFTSNTYVWCVFLTILCKIYKHHESDAERKKTQAKNWYNANGFFFVFLCEYCN